MANTHRVNRAGGWPIDEYASLRYGLGEEFDVKGTKFTDAEIADATEKGYLIELEAKPAQKMKAPASENVITSSP